MTRFVEKRELLIKYIESNNIEEAINMLEHDIALMFYLDEAYSLVQDHIKSDDINKLAEAFKVKHKRLLDAISENNSDKINEILREDISHIYVDSKASTNILKFAIEKADTQTIELLLKGWNVESKIKDELGIDFSLICYAARMGNLKIVKFLIEEIGYDIDNANDLNETALHCAINNNHIEMVKYLIAAEADIHLECHKSDTTLELSIKGGNKKIILLLALKHGLYNIDDKLREFVENHDNSGAIMGLLEFCVLSNPSRLLIDKAILTESKNKFDRVLNLAVKNRGFTDLTLEELNILKTSSEKKITLYSAKTEGEFKRCGHIHNIENDKNIRTYLKDCIIDREETLSKTLIEPKIDKYIKIKFPEPIAKQVISYIRRIKDHDVINRMRTEFSIKDRENHDFSKSYDEAQKLSESEKIEPLRKLLADKLPKLKYKNSLRIKEIALKICDELEKLLSPDQENTTKLVQELIQKTRHYYESEQSMIR